MMKGIMNNDLFKSSLLVSGIFATAFALIQISILLYSSTRGLLATLFIISLIVVAYLTCVLQLSRIIDTQQIPFLSMHLEIPSLRLLMRATYFTVLVIAGLSYLGQINMFRVISSNKDMNSIRLGNTKIYEWESQTRKPIEHISGNLYVTRISPPPLFTSMGDTTSTPSVSDLVILEDGEPLPLPHAIHIEIESSGEGRYSHWSNFPSGSSRIYYSSKDNSNPITNGRTYELQYNLFLHPLISVILLTLLGITLARSRQFSMHLLTTGKLLIKDHKVISLIILHFISLYVFFDFIMLLFDGNIKSAAAVCLLVALVAIYFQTLWWLFRISHQRDHSVLASFSLRFDPADIPAINNRYNSKLPQSYLFILMIALAIPVFMFTLFAYWSHLLTSYSLIGNYLPWSDASDWKDGADILLHTGELTDMALRRPINPAIHAMISWITGERFNWTVIIYSLFAAISAAFLASTLWRSYGLIAGFIALGIVAYFADEFLPLPLSETLGFILGVCGFAFMWRAIESRSALLFSLGLAIFSAGISARPGPVLILPMLILWSAFARTDGSKFSYRWVTCAALGVVIGVLPTLLFAQLYGTNTNFPASNYIDTFYGLTLGGESWQRAYSDIPQSALSSSERANMVLLSALENIRQHPEALLAGFAKFLNNYFTYFHWYIDIDEIKTLLMVLLIIGISSALFTFKNKHSSFLLMGAVGLLGSAPFIFWDLDAYRAYIVTIGFDAGLAALGIHSIIKFVQLNYLKFGDSNIAPIKTSSNRLLIFYSITILLILLIGPYLAISMYRQPEFAQSLTCMPDEKTALLHIRRSSPYIHIVGDGISTFAPEISVTTISAAPDIHEFGLDHYLRQLKPGEMFIRGYNLYEPSSQSTHYMSNKKLFPIDNAYYHVCGKNKILGGGGYQSYWITRIRQSIQVEVN